MLKEFEQAVRSGDKDVAVDLYKAFQGKVQEKFGPTLGSAIIGMLAFKFCSLSKDLLDVYRMVLEGRRDGDVLSGKGSIRRILKYAIELGAPVDTLDTLTEFFVDTPWFDDMPEQEEWLKLALECMMVTGNEDLGGKVLKRLHGCGGLSEEEREELMSDARRARGTIDVSWM